MRSWARCAGREAGELGRVGQWRSQARRARGEDPRLEGCGGRVRAAERAPNIQPMSVTRDVSKLSGWLKAVASCRVESRACDKGRGVQAGRRGS